MSMCIEAFSTVDAPATQETVGQVDGQKFGYVRYFCTVFHSHS